MKRLLTFIMALTASMTTMAALTVDEDYYIWLNIYEKLLGLNENEDGPALSAYGTKRDGYIFVAENSGKSGYVLLRQKSTGKYLAASSSNNWSVTLESKSTDDRFCWKADEGTYTYIINKKNGKYLGIDGANKGSNYVNVYYNKLKSSHAQYSIIPAKGSWDEARQAYESGVYTNAQGVSEIDYCQLSGKSLDRSDAIDIHITANDEPMKDGSSVNLGSDRTWLVFDNIVPSTVIKEYLKYVTINGMAAQNGENCRVAIFLNGAVVIPNPGTPMTCEGTDGSFSLEVGNHTDLGELSNTMTSFTLRRGYMATLATGTNGSWYSRVFVADHQDLTIDLPTALDRRVTSVNIKPWQYLSKKGWASTGGSYGGNQLRASWFWSWSAGYNSTTDMEYVPCRQHQYWPSASEVNKKTATAALSLNEPDHSEQHTKDKCSCTTNKAGIVEAWTAYGLNDDFQAGGGRIGSPQIQQDDNFDYLTKYFKYIDENNNYSRCDFAVVHDYLPINSRSADDYAKYVTDVYWNLWNSTKRPVWLTEMEVGATWNDAKTVITSDEKAREYLQALLQRLEESDYIERYAIYPNDWWRNYMYWNANASNGLTPAGQVYRDHRSTFAYNSKYTKVPAWWTPGIMTPTLEYEISSADNTITFLIGNDNGDTTERLELERKSIGGSWQTMTTITKRSELEPTTVRYTVPLNEIDRFSDTFRVTVTTLYDSTATSSEMGIGYISNPQIVTVSKNSVPGWTCQRSAANGYTKADSGDTFLEAWNATAADMAFDYYQNVEALTEGVYQLSAVCFNSTNNVSGASVNGNVGLYAYADGVEYFEPITTDSEIDYNRKTVIPYILVRNGSMRIGFKNQGPMTARWAGADNFELKYLGTEDEVLNKSGDAFKAEKLRERDRQLISQFPMLANNQKDATMLIANADCNRSDFYGWMVDNLETDTGQPWDSNTANAYWNKWNSGSLTSSMQQTIKYLPAGEYTLSALIRCSSGQNVTLSARHYNDLYSASITGVGTQSGDYQNGWNKVTLPPFVVASGDQIEIFAIINVQSTAWWSVDHFTLTYSSDDTTTDIRTLDDSTIGQFISPSANYFDLTGRQIVNRKLQRGVYIHNGKKYVK